MIITSKKILELNDKYKLISDLSERESTNPEGVGFDIRFDKAFKLTSGGFLGITHRDTPQIETVADMEKGDKELVFKPGDFFLVQTMESVNSPAEGVIIEKGAKPVLLVPVIFPRSTLQRSGLFLRATKTDPGYAGKLTFGIANLGGQTIKLELGSRIANLVFEEAYGTMAREYQGQWQGGRVNTKGVEKQN